MTKARRAALDFFILDVCIDVKLPWLAMSSSHYICITYNAPYVQMYYIWVSYICTLHCSRQKQLGTRQLSAASSSNRAVSLGCLGPCGQSAIGSSKADCLAVLTAWLTAVFGAASSQGRKTMNGDVLLFRRVLLQAPSWKISLQGISNIMRKLYYIVYNAQWNFFFLFSYICTFKT